MLLFLIVDFIKNKIKHISILVAFLLVSFKLFSQNQTKTNDTSNLKIEILENIIISETLNKSDFQFMPKVEGATIYAGKKTALIVMDKVQGNVVNNSMRQILSKVAGIHIWESDPSGIQIGIATRGLSPNRSWDFNVRQNGYDISADPYGYPEAYYNPPMQGVQKIEIIRGQGALQYGPQIGGMINYVLKNGSNINRPLEYETQQTFGSKGLVNMYNAIGGKQKKTNYYIFHNYRKGEGWRNNSQFSSNTFFSSITRNINSKISLSGEFLISHSLSQQPGGLTDSLFLVNPQKSLRNRNWFDIKWITPAVTLIYNINNTTQWNTKIFGVIGKRNSVGFMQSILINDSINSSSESYNNRLLNADEYNNWGLESKIISKYKLLSCLNTVVSGIRIFNGQTERNANGKGTTETEYDMFALAPYPQALIFNSNNIALFTENIIHLSPRIFLVPAVRFEFIGGSALGRNGFTQAGNEIIIEKINNRRSFVLGGVGMEYSFKNKTELYLNAAQSYRPIQFTNLLAPTSTDSIDINLADAVGTNWDIGYRGRLENWLQFDISGFILNYNNRIGAISQSTNTYKLITNVGNSMSKGIESYVEIGPVNSLKNDKNIWYKLFVSYSFTQATYLKNHKDALTKGKKVENAPRNIIRTGITFNYKSIVFTTQYNFVDQCYSDANNTINPTANGQTGLIPSYQLIDCYSAIKFKNNFEIKWGINNIFNSKYFTRRSSSYPGPGLLPGDGRTFFITIGIKS
jgi:Fe(3+) dicitrate transport protein